MSAPDTEHLPNPDARLGADASDDALGVRRLGHRHFVGGDGDNWERIGELQFRYLVARGLAPQSTLLDLACGSLRGGAHFIPYLDAGNYLGFDKSIDLVILGVAEELGIERYREKRPEFVVNHRFDLTPFTKRPDFVIAQSLFTHLTPDDTRSALRAVATVAHEQTAFYATYFPRERGEPNPARSHSRLVFYHSLDDLRAYGAESGWRFDDLGDWQHPRGQLMGRFLRA
jgi:hypothetical protein